MDFSTQSSQALKAALALARHFNARVHLFHVAADASEQKTGEAKLEALTPEPVEGVELVRAVLTGNAAAAILRYAEREKIDLIVLGTHGRTGLTRVFMGSVAEAVLRSAPCQVLTIGPKVQEVPEAKAPEKLLPASSESHCLVCAKASKETICDFCKAHIQGEAIERKRREEQAGRRGIAV
jgi:nucleotide-binding universal stress UspA family protein